MRRPYALLPLLLPSFLMPTFLIYASPAWAADTYQGAMVCTAVPGSGPTRSSRFTVHIHGPRLTYSHQVLDDIRTYRELSEIGNGRIDNGQIQLNGAATAPGFRESGHYTGTLQNETLTLQGQETWENFFWGVNYAWPCTATLKPR